ncbi:amino acid adenylation domain-containing protein [Ancylothrix sp. C2]|uniref:non-ribosomal peptide synthetase n=1 Tax=Ancylothrix sp. D3o TaxID=2953691 RepID=UPI0021BB33C2|nr:non-ribosomal peptide synthetase [Ancylothrix sp. D3o]MCT7950209.1 amino acid adenylation domain-containing protein [Ancylothrix sp. D3o]
MTQPIKDITALSATKRALFEALIKDKGLTISKIPKLSRENPNKYYPLSFAQQRLWFLEQIEPGNSVYNETISLRIKGELNITALEYSINEIISRHEILRTTFVSLKGEAFQVISNDEKLALSVTKISGLSPSEKEKKCDKLRSQLVKQTFDLTKWPLMRANLFQFEENEFVLFLVLHHLITDGWSSDRFIREMAAIYEAYLADQPASLPELPIQYADFASWQKQWLSGEVLNRQISYWKKQLSGPLPVLELPIDYPRPAIQSFVGAKESLMLSKPVSDQINRFCQQQEVTLFMTLLAGFQILLYRHTGQEDILIGSPIAGRNRAEIENLIGFFINTLVFRNQLDENSTFHKLLQRVRRVALDAYAHQDLPFEKLVEELQPDRDLSRTPVFQVFFNLLNFGIKTIDVAGLTWETLPRPEAEAKFDLTLYAREKSEVIQLEFVYNAGLFTSARIKEMLIQLSAIIEQAVNNSETKINQFSLVTVEAQKLLPHPEQFFNIEQQLPIHQLFGQQAQRVPQQAAVSDERQTWNYQELDTTSNQLANYLLQNGIESQEIIAIYAHRSAALVCGLLGVLKAGAAFLILDAKYPPERLIDCIKIAQPKAWIQMEAAGEMPEKLQEFIEAFSWKVNGFLPKTLGQIQNLFKEFSNELPAKEIKEDNLAYVAFTSGSTGQPKGILGTHGPVSHFLKWHTQTFKFDESDRFSMLSGLSHDPLLRDIFTPLSIGACLHIPNPDKILTPTWLGDWIQQCKITVVHLTPAMGEILTSGVKQPLTSLRYLFFGGDVLTVQEIKKIQKIATSATCVNFYGATETPQAMGYYIANDLSYLEQNEQAKIPIGRGIKDVQLLILNSSQQLAGIGELGEIYIRTPYLAKAYLGDQTLTQQRFITNSLTNIAEDRLYKTGDLGRYLPGGEIVIAGRADNQIKIRGFRIEPAEIETLLNRHPNIQQSAVIARSVTSSADKYLVAYIVINAQQIESKTHSQELIIEEIRNFLKEKLPDYMIPSFIVILDTLPLTPNGKLDRRALPAPEFSKTPEKESFTSARDEIETQLVEIWQKTLGVQPISVKDNYFELGGHSLLAVRLFSQIEETFNKKLPLAVLFQAPTIEQIAQILRQRNSSFSWETLVPIQTKGSKPPLFCVHAIGGNVLSYMGLAIYLGPDQPIYGLQARGLDGQQPPHTKMEDMAADYIKEMRNVQPQGPYFLAGHSLGGLIAFEIAQQLVAAGETVAFLGMFDSFSPTLFNKETPPFSYQMSIHKLNLSRLQGLQKVTYITDRVYWKIKPYIQKINNQFNLGLDRFLEEKFGGGISINQVKSFQHIEEANREAAKNYSPGIYSGKITLFQAIERPTNKYHYPLLGWEEFTESGVEVVEVPGHHKTLILEPYIRFLAEKLKLCLEKAV